MGAHSAARGGRSVTELLERASLPRSTGRSTRPEGATTIPSPRVPSDRPFSAFSLVAATAVGASAAAGMTGAFAAVPAATAAPAKPSDTQPMARQLVQPVALTASPAAPAAAPQPAAQPAVAPAITAPPANAVAAPAPAAPAVQPAVQPATAPADAAPAAGPLGGAVEQAMTGGGTVLAADLHQADATQIAALSRSVDMARVAAERAAEQAKQAAFILRGSPTAFAALDKARGKLGVPYVWGATGPNAFDCSGLVQWAFKQVGVNLPRVAEAQSTVGTPVDRNNLKPGDLVFFYSPVSHVGIYIGDNKILHASESGQPVKISDMSHFPFHNARRV